MVERVADLPEGVLGVRATGTELRLFDPGETAAAKAWVAGPSPEPG